MKPIRISVENAAAFVGNEVVNKLIEESAPALDKVLKGTGAGNDFLGWVHLPSETPNDLIADICKTADMLRSECETVVVIGIGGSYLGAKAVIEALNNSFDHLTPGTKGCPNVLFAGQNISEDYLSDLCDYLKGRTFGIVVISKSGTTTEPAIAFRVLKTQLEQQSGVETARRHIVAITDASRGALRTLATQEGYKTYVIADNVGGRFSVFTPVGLLPIAVAGHNIVRLIDGARNMEAATNEANRENPAVLYAAMRNALYRDGKKIEIMVNYDPKLHFLAEWWKQLYGESEGKDHKGIFPAAVDNTTDLHSMGQWIQDGERTIFETVLTVDNAKRNLAIPHDDQNLDGLNYLAGKRVSEVNAKAQQATTLAHVDGGVPNICIAIDAINEQNLGELLYMFEKACGISGYMLDVNPFNQPGVEDYKRNMFALLHKPGYEDMSAALEARIQK